MWRKIIWAIVLVLLSFYSFSQSNENADQAAVSPSLKLDFPLFDLPYQIDAADTVGYGFFSSYSVLSMNQSLALTKNVYSSMHYGLKHMYDRLTWDPVWKNIVYVGGTAAGIVLFAYIFPFGYPWMQLEFQRAALAHSGIASENGYYGPIKFSGHYTDGLTDGELEQMKAISPIDFIRLQEVGIEAYALFSENILRDRFFYDLNDLSWVTALITTFLTFSEVCIGVQADPWFPNIIDIDQGIQNLYEKDGREETRYLYGNAVYNWVYELFRPDEPYTARGPHPSGDGTIARYITIAQLTDEEKQYLVTQGYLSILNLLSPMLYGFNGIPLGKSGLTGNFAVHHYLTSFGADIQLQTLLKKEPFNLVFTLHNYMNYANYFPAIEVELVDFQLSNLIPLPFFEKVYVSPRLLIGMQPKDQVFKTADPEFLGTLGLRVDFAITKYLRLFTEFMAKTDGWIAGNEYLNRNVSFTLGISLCF